MGNWVEYQLSYSSYLSYGMAHREDWNFNTFHVAECSHAPIKIIGEYSIKFYRIYKINEKLDIPII
jgi:hypothetical protein